MGEGDGGVKEGNSGEGVGVRRERLTNRETERCVCAREKARREMDRQTARERDRQRKTDTHEHTTRCLCAKNLVRRAGKQQQQ